MNQVVKKFEDIYSAPDIAPRTYTQIPDELRHLVQDNIIPKLSKILEIGCGEGHQAIFLAQAGFDVTAIDRSEHAIMFAQQNAIAQKVTVDFRTQEYHDIAAYKEHFDFIFDWRFLHEITDENQRDMYIKIIDTLLTPNGKYLSVAFSGDTDFMGTGTVRKSPAGIEIYFSTLKVLESLVTRHLHIIDSKHIIVPQKPNLQVQANYIFAEKIK